MQTIPLRALPNQTATFTLNQTRYSITIKETSGTMAANISVNEVEIISGLEIAAEAPLIPYQYLENGNLTIVTSDEEVPYYTEFGISQFLVYIPQSELDEARQVQ